MAYKDTDFMYASARVSVFETRLLTREKYMQLIDAASEKDAVSLLGDACAPVYTDGAFDIEATLEGLVDTAFTEVAKSIPDAKLFDFMRYEFDANNLKAAIKAKVGGMEADGMLFACGTVSTAAAEEAVESGNFAAFPKHMAAAAPKALEAYAATRDPQRIDLAVDRAAFADMLDAAAADKTLTDAVKLRIDAINVQSAVRMLDAGKAAGLSAVLLEGGNLPVKTFTVTDRAALAAALDEKDTEVAVLLADADASLAEIGRATEKLLGEKTGAQFVPFGLAKIYAYLSAVQREAKNLRIIFALRAAHADRDTILQNIRV